MLTVIFSVIYLYTSAYFFTSVIIYRLYVIAMIFFKKRITNMLFFGVLKQGKYCVNRVGK